MRIPRSLVSLLLAVSVLAGQWLTATHESDHGLQPGASHACAICVYAHGAGAGALPALPTLTLEVAHAAPELPALASAYDAILRDHPIRGPPSLS